MGHTLLVWCIHLRSHNLLHMCTPLLVIHNNTCLELRHMYQQVFQRLAALRALPSQGGVFAPFGPIRAGQSRVRECSHSVQPTRKQLALLG